MTKRTTTMWAIEGEFLKPGGGTKRELYVGTFVTRKGMIHLHTHPAHYQEDSWAECRKRGDRAVKVTMTWYAGGSR
jgi:hypothetical protein